MNIVRSFVVPAFAGVLFLALTSFAAEDRQVIPLWENGAPGFEDRRTEPEQAASYWVKNIHNPNLTVFHPPKEKANGAAIVVCPGGGFRELVFNGEGVDAARFLTNLGVAAFALKYRLPRETNSPYKLPDHAIQDAQRAMRLVRSRATEWDIDPKRIGIIGFSAGGEMASFASFTPGEGNPDAADPIDRLNARPDFQIMIYPGPLGIPDVILTDAPPAFWLSANDDNGPARSIATILPKYRAAKVPIEVHLYAKGGHAFNMGTRSKLTTLQGWPQRLADWLADNEFLKPSAAAVTSSSGAAPAREIKLLEVQSDKYHFSFDTSEAPDLAEWTEEKLVPVVKEWYPKLVAMLPSDGYEASTNVLIRYRTDMGGTPASAGGGRINCNAQWFRKNLKGEAAGAVVHEMVHVVQSYGRGRRDNPDAKRNPGWLVEGLADYIRWFLYEPETKGAEITPRNLERAKHDASYRITGNFLNWVAEKHGQDIIWKLNAAMRQAKYDESLWEELTGNSLQSLGQEWRSMHEERLAKKSE